MDDKKINKDASANLQNSDSITKKRRHISSAELTAFKQDKLKTSELEEFLNHIVSCDYCSDLLAESMENQLISAPVDMKANILNKSKQFNVQISKRKKSSKQMKLFKYSLKVVAASLFAITLMLSTNKLPYISNQDIKLTIEIPVRDSTIPSLTASMRNNMDQLSYEILEFSNTIINTEVIKNDQKEK